MSAGRLIGVGVGPGDPDLMTLKAIRTLREADLVVHFGKNSSPSNARKIAAFHLPKGIEELALRYPITTELPKHDENYRSAITKFYDDASSALAAKLDAGKIVAVLCEGDPLFYGSYMHLHTRLAGNYTTEVIAGVTGMSGCWSALRTPIAQGDDVLTVLPGTLPEAELARRIGDADAAVIMKVGSNLAKIRRALKQSGRLARAIYVERGTMTNEVMLPLCDKSDDQAPYFAMVLVPGWERAS